MKDYVDKITNKFLSWELPQSVCSDACVTDSSYIYARTGTNLLSFTEARLMVVHLFSELLDEHENLQKFATQYEESARDWKANYEELESENRILKAQLELAIKQRNLSLAGWFCSADTRNDHIVLLKKRKFDKELDSIGSEK